MNPLKTPEQTRLWLGIRADSLDKMQKGLGDPVEIALEKGEQSITVDGLTLLIFAEPENRMVGLGLLIGIWDSNWTHEVNLNALLHKAEQERGKLKNALFVLGFNNPDTIIKTFLIHETDS